MPAPNRQTLALSFFEIASSDHRPQRVAFEDPPARFHQIMDRFFEWNAEVIAEPASTESPADSRHEPSAGAAEI